MEDKAEDIKVEEMLEKDRFCSSKKNNFDVEVKETDDETYFHKDKKAVVDIGVTEDEGINVSKKDKVRERMKFISNI